MLLQISFVGDVEGDGEEVVGGGGLVQIVVVFVGRRGEEASYDLDRGIEIGRLAKEVSVIL